MGLAANFRFRQKQIGRSFFHRNFERNIMELELINKYKRQALQPTLNEAIADLDLSTSYTYPELRTYQRLLSRSLRLSNHPR